MVSVMRKESCSLAGFSSFAFISGTSGKRRKPAAFLRGPCSVYICTHTYVLNGRLVSDLKSEIDKLATEYISNARTLSSEEKLGLLKQIQEAYGKCKEFGDDKVQLAMQTYEMV